MNIEEAINMICDELGGNKIELSSAADGGKYLVVFKAFDREFVCDTGEFDKMNKALHFLQGCEVVR